MDAKKYYLKVIPNSKKEALLIDGDKIIARIKAKAEKGKANKELLALLSKRFGKAEIVSGFKSRQKVVLIQRA